MDTTNYPLHSAAVADRVLVVTRTRAQIAPILEAWAQQLVVPGERELAYGARVYRASGRERITFPHGGRIDFASLRTLDARVRSRSLDLVQFAAGISVTDDDIATVTPALHGSQFARIVDECGIVRRF